MSTTLTIPDLDEAVEQRLRRQAASHGRSIQSEAREILSQSLEGNHLADEDALSAQMRLRQRIDSVTGIWKGRLSTDEIMQMTRGE